MGMNLFLCTLEQCAQDDQHWAPCISWGARFHAQISQTACKFRSACTQGSPGPSPTSRKPSGRREPFLGLYAGTSRQLRAAPQELRGTEWWSSRAHTLEYTKASWSPSCFANILTFALVGGGGILTTLTGFSWIAKKGGSQRRRFLYTFLYINFAPIQKIWAQGYLRSGHEVRSSDLTSFF